MEKWQKYIVRKKRNESVRDLYAAEIFHFWLLRRTLEDGSCTQSLGGMLIFHKIYIWVVTNMCRDKSMQLSRSVARKTWSACKTNGAETKSHLVSDARVLWKRTAARNADTSNFSQGCNSRNTTCPLQLFHEHNLNAALFPLNCFAV